MRRDMVAVGMRDEREWFRIPRVEPDILFRQKNTALVTDLNHASNLRRVFAGENYAAYGRIILATRFWRRNSSALTEGEEEDRCMADELSR